MPLPWLRASLLLETPTLWFLGRVVRGRQQSQCLLLGSDHCCCSKTRCWIGTVAKSVMAVVEKDVATWLYTLGLPEWYPTAEAGTGKESRAWDEQAATVPMCWFFEHALVLLLLLTGPASWGMVAGPKVQQWSLTSAHWHHLGSSAAHPTERDQECPWSERCIVICRLTPEEYLGWFFFPTGRDETMGHRGHN